VSDTPLTVSELNRIARTALERSLPLCWVLGEVSNLTRAASGHLYFTLKDDATQVRCVMFRSRAQLLPWRLENGQQVEARALATLYEARGDFQLGIENLRRSGLGRLFEAFARLKEILAAEGLFAIERKRALPRYPRTVGIVTSPQAAALRDLLAALRRRAPNIEAIVYPTAVQGGDAALQIAAMIARAAARRECDVLIVARGGGSIEDLWAFNEEVVARAIAASSIPIISGVGHETDVTIADFVADQRAATPTAAAELASAGWHAATMEIEAATRALRQGMQRRINKWMQCVDLLGHRLIHPADALSLSRQRLEHSATRLQAAMQRRLRRSENRLTLTQLGLAQARPQPEQHRTRLALAAQTLRSAAQIHLAARRHTLSRLDAALAALAPEATLKRGYSIVRDAAGHVVRSSAHLAPGAEVSLLFAEGKASARITSAD